MKREGKMDKEKREGRGRKKEGRRRKEEGRWNAGER